MSRLQTLPPLGGRPAGGYVPTLPPLRGRSYEAYRRETVGQLRQLMAEATADALVWTDSYKRACRESVARMAYPAGSTICRAYRSRDDAIDESCANHYVQNRKLCIGSIQHRDRPGWHRARRLRPQSGYSF